MHQFNVSLQLPDDWDTKAFMDYLVQQIQEINPVTIRVAGTLDHDNDVDEVTWKSTPTIINLKP